MLLYNTKDPDRITNLDTFTQIEIIKVRDFDRCEIRGIVPYDIAYFIAVLNGKDAKEQARKILKQIKDGYDNGSSSITITADPDW